VLGDSNTAVTNTDDFLVRMLRGCIQLSARPNSMYPNLLAEAVRLC
jgi:thioester reductase-like protein